jgi:hypothetical protein
LKERFGGVYKRATQEYGTGERSPQVIEKTDIKFYVGKCINPKPSASKTVYEVDFCRSSTKLSTGVVDESNFCWMHRQLAELGEGRSDFKR